MLQDDAALYGAILRHPKEDTPRLALADWHDEHGQGERAEFIRLQCKLAQHRRRAVLTGLSHLSHPRPEDDTFEADIPWRADLMNLLGGRVDLLFDVDEDDRPTHSNVRLYGLLLMQVMPYNDWTGSPRDSMQFHCEFLRDRGSVPQEHDAEWQRVDQLALNQANVLPWVPELPRCTRTAGPTPKGVCGAWLSVDPARPQVVHFDILRGFVGGISCAWRSWLRVADDLVWAGDGHPHPLAPCPIEAVHLTGTWPGLNNLLRWDFGGQPGPSCISKLRKFVPELESQLVRGRRPAGSTLEEDMAKAFGTVWPGIHFSSSRVPDVAAL